MTSNLNSSSSGGVSSLSAQNMSSQLIKKLSVFDRVQAKPLVDSIVEVLDFELDESKDESVTAISTTTTQLNKQLDNMIISDENTLDKYHCLTCDIKLLNRTEQIEHYKGDLHLFNLKQKMKGKAVVSVEEFERLTDISSISGSDNDEDARSSSSSSLSESESESDDKQQLEKTSTARNKAATAASTNKAKIMFKLNDSSILAVFKCILFPKNEYPSSSKEIINRFKSICNEDKWCIILVAAGHFAAAVFKGDQPILHKTFHRYVVRAKRGTVQSVHDSAGRNARSAGANIRRHQEAAFKDDIRLLIGTEWKSELDKCKCIFIRVPKYNRSVLISSSSSSSGEAPPFDRVDPRLRHIPFMTFRPTFNEVKRTHTILSKIENYDPKYIEFINKFNPKSSSPSSQKEASSPSKIVSTNKSQQKSSKQKDPTNETTAKQPPARANKPSEESSDSSSSSTDDEEDKQKEKDSQTAQQEQQQAVTVPPKANEFIKSLCGDELKLFNEIYTCCATNNAVKLQQIFMERVGDRDDKSANTSETQSILIERLLNMRLNADVGFTLLHLTSQLGFAECLWWLLMNGADPAVCDLTKQRRLPYYLSLNKPTRDAYRRFMSEYPNRYDWTAAKVSSPLTTEKLEKDREKKKAQRKQKKKRDADKQRAVKQLEAEEAEKKLFLSLSDQQKRQLIAGRNFFNAVPLNEPNKQSAIKVISRCWYCAKDMSTHVPFEYFDYKFCSTKCLNSHRQSQQSQKN